MVFSSLAFIFLILPLFLICDSAARLVQSVPLRNLVLLTVSLFFYLWGEAANVFLLFALGCLNYLAGLYISRSRKPFLLAFCIALNLVPLIGYKYFHWLVSLFVADTNIRISVMPLGISFFTFHAISYLIDIYRNTIRPAKNSLDFLTYFCMFPHLVAGPIVRYAQVQTDLQTRGPSNDLYSYGIYRFLVGLNKKILIANPASIIADEAFKLSVIGDLGCSDAWLGMIAYTVQIYFDFSGYSDMAIGLAALAGFRFEENFRRPYSSTSIREFWQRWHISLSSWFRDYLYIPLGGSRSSSLMTYRNLILVFFICGLWHGANFTFIIWGLWHGLFLVLERIGSRFRIPSFPSWFCRVYTLLIVMIGWVFFRAPDLSHAAAYLGSLFSPSMDMTLDYYHSSLAALSIGFLLCLIPDRLLPSVPDSHNPQFFTVPAYVFQIAFAVLSISLLVTGGRNPFIYFNF